MKFDFLGLKTLTMIHNAVRLIDDRGETDHAPPLDLANLPLDDAATYALLASGRTTGIFQLESPGMRNLLVRIKPEHFEDLIAILALYRPGPLESGMVDDFIKRKRDPAQITYDPATLEPILKDTYGVIVYQEQVMATANRIAGFSLGQADLLRRAMGKKKPEEMEKQKALFVQGAQKNHLSERKAEKLFDLMAYFAGYGFNKSHSAAYAVVTYQTAYLKAHYPIQFMAALLTSEMGNADKMVGYFTECRDLGIRILPPDVNESETTFTVVDGGIRFGLAAIKNVGEGAVESIIATRNEGGRFRSFYDFCHRIDLHKVNKRVLEGLIKTGAFDSTGAKRSQLAGVWTKHWKTPRQPSASENAAKRRCSASTRRATRQHRRSPILPSLRFPNGILENGSNSNASSPASTLPRIRWLGTKPWSTNSRPPPAKGSPSCRTAARSRCAASSKPSKR